MSEKLSSFRVEEEVLRSFKSKVSYEGKTISGVLSDFMKEYVGEAKQQKEEKMIIEEKPMTEEEQKKWNELEKNSVGWEEKNKDWLPKEGSLDGGRTASTDEFTKKS